MRPYAAPTKITSFDDVQRQLRDVAAASQAERVVDVTGAFSVENATIPVRELDATTATAQDICNFLATLLDDFDKQGE